MIKPKQQQLIRFIDSYIRDYGYSPSTSEIAHGTSSYPSLVNYHIKMLSLKGYLTHTPGKPRTLRVIKREEQ